ncbi:Cytochrome P450 monooxygenase gsfF [Lasiodiplodia hormozganensis]|uniref:Cytochrome P450 monooxygenase gsfF n=1 Tax=Lasiodiplodia hormozganensis TaxID=869390 RepID=A0AA39Z5E8_9PEZI|nr:Cytochrome P450 monooxygenase gsfF [Lasiodiplodia hormozganensis]
MGLLSGLSFVDFTKAASLLLLLPLAYIAVIGIYRVYDSLFGRLRNVPGPWLAKYTGLWELQAIAHGDFEQKNIALHKQHGKVVRIGPNKYSIDDPDAVRLIYGHGTKFTKTYFYYAFRDPHVSNLFAELDVKEHSTQRRRIASLYSMTTLLSYESFIDSCTTVLMEKFNKFAREHRPVEMVQWLQFYAFDVIGAITTSSPFGLMSAESDQASIIAAIHKTLVYGGHVGAFAPALHPYLAGLSSLMGKPPPTEPVQNYIKRQIALRRQQFASGDTKFTTNTDTDDSPAPATDFLTKLLRLESAGPNTPFDTLNASGSNIAAGSDTTAITLSAVVYYLLRNPHVLQKLRAELEQAAAAGEISDPITYAQAQRCAYLQAVLKESLRAHPAVAQPMMRRVPAGPGVEIVPGTWLPAGTEVGVNPWVAHRNEEVFGADAAAFRPERWLEADEKAKARMESYFLAFGHGSRTCIGKHISLLEISKVIPQLVRHFDFEFVNPEQEWHTETAWFCKQQYQCYIKPRAA